ncbi:hypothetical protein BESB_054350 [Besnoitia besnoiti]|uniref:Uncharacterized protein n=1 Tax=Besnoitia besnoiti TaxID=94643 RepID=A0A2A9MF02_BESBE|nr:hypothetical protein BESB_054350 [Besnoitia besnoiti]PFH35784.1 hypothetical protein BESB_054350 [Besnoitia besnoiti]
MEGRTWERPRMGAPVVPSAPVAMSSAHESFMFSLFVFVILSRINSVPAAQGMRLPFFRWLFPRLSQPFSAQICKRCVFVSSLVALLSLCSPFLAPAPSFSLYSPPSASASSSLSPLYVEVCAAFRLLFASAAAGPLWHAPSTTEAASAPVILAEAPETPQRGRATTSQASEAIKIVDGRAQTARVESPRTRHPRVAFAEADVVEEFPSAGADAGGWRSKQPAPPLSASHISEKAKPGAWLDGFLSWVATSAGAVAEDDEDYDDGKSQLQASSARTSLLSSTVLDVSAVPGAAELNAEGAMSARVLFSGAESFVLALTVVCNTSGTAHRRLYWRLPRGMTASDLVNSFAMGAPWLGGPGGSLLHLRLCVAGRQSYRLTVRRGFGDRGFFSGEDFSRKPLAQFLSSVTPEDSRGLLAEPLTRQQTAAVSPLASVSWRAKHLFGSGAATEAFEAAGAPQGDGLALSGVERTMTHREPDSGRTRAGLTVVIERRRSGSRRADERGGAEQRSDENKAGSDVGRSSGDARSRREISASVSSSPRSGGPPSAAGQTAEWRSGGGDATSSRRGASADGASIQIALLGKGHLQASPRVLPVTISVEATLSEEDRQEQVGGLAAGADDAERRGPRGRRDGRPLPLELVSLKSILSRASSRDTRFAFTPDYDRRATAVDGDGPGGSVDAASRGEGDRRVTGQSTIVRIPPSQSSSTALPSRRKNLVQMMKETAYQWRNNVFAGLRKKREEARMQTAGPPASAEAAKSIAALDEGATNFFSGSISSTLDSVKSLFASSHTFTHDEALPESSTRRTPRLKRRHARKRERGSLFGWLFGDTRDAEAEEGEQDY